MTKAPIYLQDLRRSLYVKAKTEPTWRFWGLYVHVCKMETLQEAYQMAKSNDGAPGIDGVRLAAIEEGGVERFLKQIQDELVNHRYQPMPVRRKAQRFLDAFATVDDATTLDQLLQRLEQPRQWRGRRVRALRPLADDRALLSAINHGEFAIHGFRNRDLRAIFFRQTTDDKQQRRHHSAWISRKLRLLRAHALITKIVGTHRYQLTSSGRRISVAILSALRSTVAQLTPVTAQLTALAA